VFDDRACASADVMAGFGRKWLPDNGQAQKRKKPKRRAGQLLTGGWWLGSGNKPEDCELSASILWAGEL
jgi:hypothetical protein